MADARVRATDTLPERSRYNFVWPELFLPYDEFSNCTILFVEAELEKDGIVSRSKIVKATLQQSAADVEARRTALKQIPGAIDGCVLRRLIHKSSTQQAINFESWSRSSDHESSIGRRSMG